MSINPLIHDAVSLSAQLIAQYLDGPGEESRRITPEQLSEKIILAEQARASEREWLIIEAIKQIPAEQIDMVRQFAGGIAADLRRWHPVEGGQWHPYLAILAQPPLLEAHPQHVAIIRQHGAWYHQEMEKAMDWLFPGSNGKPSGN